MVYVEAQETSCIQVSCFLKRKMFSSFLIFVTIDRFDRKGHLISLPAWTLTDCFRFIPPCHWRRYDKLVHSGIEFPLLESTDDQSPVQGFYSGVSWWSETRYPCFWKASQLPWLHLGNIRSFHKAHPFMTQYNLWINCRLISSYFPKEILLRCCKTSRTSARLYCQAIMKREFWIENAACY